MGLPIATTSQVQSILNHLVVLADCLEADKTPPAETVKFTCAVGDSLRTADPSLFREIDPSFHRLQLLHDGTSLRASRSMVVTACLLLFILVGTAFAMYYVGRANSMDLTQWRRDWYADRSSTITAILAVHNDMISSVQRANEMLATAEHLRKDVRETLATLGADAATLIEARQKLEHILLSWEEHWDAVAAENARVAALAASEAALLKTVAQK